MMMRYLYDSTLHHPNLLLFAVNTSILGMPVPAHYVCCCITYSFATCGVKLPYHLLTELWSQMKI